MLTLAAPSETQFQSAVLGNGLRVVTSDMAHTRSVTVSVFVGVGSRYEPPELAGASHLVEHMVFKGTERRPTARDISVAVEGVGGVINAGTEQELTVYWCKVARPYMNEAIDLLIDMVRNSLFENEEVDRERLVVLEEQRMINDHPGYKVEALIDDMLWPDHPLGRDVAGTAESVKSMTRESIVDLASRFYTPSNIVVSVAGSVEHDEVVAQVEALSEGWASQTTADWEPFRGEQAEPRSTLEYRRSEQTYFAIAIPALPMTHPDRYALDLLSATLGEGMSSRLFVEIRENRGLAYEISSGLTYFQDCGALMIHAGVAPRRVYSAVDTVLAELSKIKSGIPEEELERAKRLITGRLLLRMEDTRAVSAWMGAQELLTGQMMGVDEAVTQVNAVARDDVLKVSNDLLRGDKLNMAVVGPNRSERRLIKSLAL